MFFGIRLHTTDDVVEIGRGGRERLIASLTRSILCKGGNPVFTMGAGIMDENIGLRLSGVLAARMRAGERYTGVGIGFRRFLTHLGMADGEMLEIRGFLDKF